MGAVSCAGLLAVAPPALAQQQGIPASGVGVAQSALLFEKVCYEHFPDAKAMQTIMGAPELHGWQLSSDPRSDDPTVQHWSSKFADVSFSAEAKGLTEQGNGHCSVTTRLHGKRAHAELVSALFYLIEPKPSQIAWPADEGPSAWKVSRPQGDQQIELTSIHTAEEDTVWTIKLTNLPTRAN